MDRSWWIEFVWRHRRFLILIPVVRAEGRVRAQVTCPNLCSDSYNSWEMRLHYSRNSLTYTKRRDRVMNPRDLSFKVTQIRNPFIFFGHKIHSLHRLWLFMFLILTNIILYVTFFSRDWLLKRFSSIPEDID